jgi:hypothetical protein
MEYVKSQRAHVENCMSLSKDTERRGRVLNTPASYSGGAGFDSRPQPPAILIDIVS